MKGTSTRPGKNGHENQVITVSDEFTEYALHLAATNILILVRLYKNNK